MKRLIMISICLFFFAACASQRPVLYPNNTLQYEGSAAAQAEIDDCMSLASEYGASGGKGGEIAREAAENAAVGGTAGAVAGAIYNGKVGKGAAVGAAGAGCF